MSGTFQARAGLQENYLGVHLTQAVVSGTAGFSAEHREDPRSRAPMCLCNLLANDGILSFPLNEDEANTWYSVIIGEKCCRTENGREEAKRMKLST